MHNCGSSTSLPALILFFCFHSFVIRKTNYTVTALSSTIEATAIAIATTAITVAAGVVTGCFRSLRFLFSCVSPAYCCIIDFRPLCRVIKKIAVALSRRRAPHNENDDEKDEEDEGDDCVSGGSSNSVCDDVRDTTTILPTLP